MKNSTAVALFLIVTGAIVAGNLFTDCVRSYFAQKAVENAEHEASEKWWEELRQQTQ